MNSFDQRQFEKMCKVIDSFKRKTISLSSFVSSMEFLFHALESVDISWEEEFLEEISSLESVNSGVPSSVSDEAVQKIINDAVEKLDTLISQMLSR